jgi:hypothetical protein
MKKTFEQRPPRPWQELEARNRAAFMAAVPFASVRGARRTVLLEHHGEGKPCCAAV